MTDDARLAAEQRARVLVDQQLTEAGWLVQGRKNINLFAGWGVSMREMIIAKGHGRADDSLDVDQRVAGVIEVKPAGVALSGVELQSAMYVDGVSPEVRLKVMVVDGRLSRVRGQSFGNRTSRTVTPLSQTRRLSNVPKPETSAPILLAAERDPAEARDIAGAAGAGRAAHEQGSGRDDPQDPQVPRRAAVRPFVGADGHQGG
ncbi:hypothetical protein Q5530_33785 [Saccharothrix sp. BKS2]|uniref:hypothetical protein n=1 Tax=Saccharothrix sp. BKS2 TaxID=3064400 RepID=UPI0039ED8E53